MPSLHAIAAIRTAYEHEKSHTQFSVLSDKIFYHWTYDEMLVGKPRQLTKVEMRLKYDLSSMTMGGGLYVSKNPFEWQAYGNRLFIIEVIKPLKLLDISSLCQTLHGEYVSPQDLITILGGVEALRQDGFSCIYNSQYLHGEYNFIDPAVFVIRPLQQTDVARLHQFESHILVENTPWVAMPAFDPNQTTLWWQYRTEAVIAARTKISSQAQLPDQCQSTAFLMNLLDTFEFTDYYDILHVLAVVTTANPLMTPHFARIFDATTGLDLRNHPWNRYRKLDTYSHPDAILQTWRKVINEGREAYEQINRFQPKGIASNLARGRALFDLLRWINKQVQPDFASGETRRKDISAAGDVFSIGPQIGQPMLFGQSDPNSHFRVSDDFHVPGCFRASQQDVIVADNNPFLIKTYDYDVTFISNRITDGGGQSYIPDGAPHIVRFQYPHIERLAEMRQKPAFTAYISHEKINEFENRFNALRAEKDNNVISGEVFEQRKASLNQEMLEYFAITVLSDPHLSDLKQYQYLITIHPFFDGNGRGCRAFYQITADKPLLMRDWNRDFFTTEDELAHEYAVFSYIKEALVQELLNAKDQKRPAAFYEVPALWRAFTDASIHRNDLRVDEIKAFIRNHEIYIEKKLPEDLKMHFHRWLNAPQPALSSTQTTLFATQGSKPAQLPQQGAVLVNGL